jgi:predicted nucleic acid-binding protein
VIVADANLLAYLLVSGPLTAAAERVRAKEKIWIAPPLLRYELLNVLARYVIAGQIERDEAARSMKRGVAMVELSVLNPDPITILNLSAQSGCSTYDLQYVWLAEETDLPLVTADRKILAAFPNVAVDITDFAAR